MEEFTAITQENPTFNIDQAVELYMNKRTEVTDIPNTFSNIIKGVNSASKVSEKQATFWKNNNFLKQRGFSYSPQDRATDTLEVVMNNPAIAVGFYDDLYDIVNSTKDNYTKKSIDKAQNTPSEPSRAWDAYAVFTKSLEASTSISRDLYSYFYEKLNKKDDAGNKIPIGKTADLEAIDAMENILRFAA